MYPSEGGITVALKALFTRCNAIGDKNVTRQTNKSKRRYAQTGCSAAAVPTAGSKGVVIVVLRRELGRRERRRGVEKDATAASVGRRRGWHSGECVAQPKGARLVVYQASLFGVTVRETVVNYLSNYNI